MPPKKSFGMMKPDALERHMEQDIRQMITASGMLISKEKEIVLSPDEVDVIYGYAKHQYFYDDFKKYLITHKVIVFEVESINEDDDAIDSLNYLVGPTNPKDAAPYMIRFFGEDLRRNLIHSGSNEEEVKKSLSKFFAE